MVTADLKVRVEFEVVAVVEDLRTLRSTACVRIVGFGLWNDGKEIFDVLSMMEIPE